MLTRPTDTPRSLASTDSISHTQAPHCRPSTASVSSFVPSGLVDDMPSKVPSFGRFRPQSAGTDRVHALKVVTAETEALYDVVSCRAASAAELAPRRGRQAAMRTNRLREFERGRRQRDARRS